MSHESHHAGPSECAATIPLATFAGGDGSRLHGVCRRTADPTHRAPAAANGRPVVEQKRMPQVICILSQHCWQPFFSKVLEVVDQLLAPHAACRDLPADAPAALFLASLPRALVAAGPPLPRLGAVLRVPLPYSAAPISVDRMRRALAPPPGPGGRAGDHLLGLSPDGIELEVGAGMVVAQGWLSAADSVYRRLVSPRLPPCHLVPALPSHFPTSLSLPHPTPPSGAA